MRRSYRYLYGLPVLAVCLGLTLALVWWPLNAFHNSDPTLSRMEREFAFNAFDCANDRKGDTGCDQAILDGGRTGLIRKKCTKCFHARHLKLQTLI